MCDRDAPRFPLPLPGFQNTEVEAAALPALLLVELAGGTLTASPGFQKTLDVGLEVEFVAGVALVPMLLVRSSLCLAFHLAAIARSLAFFAFAFSTDGLYNPTGSDPAAAFSRFFASFSSMAFFLAKARGPSLRPLAFSENGCDIQSIRSREAAEGFASPVIGA